MRRYAACSTAEEVIATQDEWLATGGGPVEYDGRMDYPPSESESEYTDESDDDQDPAAPSLTQSVAHLSLGNTTQQHSLVAQDEDDVPAPDSVGAVDSAQQ